MNSTVSALHDLERRVAQLLDRHEILRKENASLRQQVLDAGAERDALAERMALAAARLETLRDTLPADA